MSCDFLDSKLSTRPVDKSIEKYKWTKLTAGNTASDFEKVWNSIAELYWSGVEREVAAAIIAFGEFDEQQADSLPVENYRPEDLKTTHLAKLIDLWNPFDTQTPSGAQFGSSDQLRKLEERVQARVATELETLTTEERRAQALLQSLGLLDIDFVRERRHPIFSSLGQRPQIESDEDESLLEAVQCSKCRRCIRAFHWYECRSGCQDYTHKTNMFSIPCCPYVGSEGIHESIARRSHDYTLCKSRQTRLPYRLCPPCFARSQSSYDHLQVVRRFPVKFGTEKRSSEFALELDMWEDQLDGRQLMGFGGLTMDRLASGSSFFTRASTRDRFPAGNTHCAVMLGPLIIENGSAFMPSGARISLRDMPNFSTLSLENLQEAIFEPTDYIWLEERETPTQQHLAISHERHLYSATHPVQQRRFMCTQKQIAGGAFTLFNPLVADDERQILRQFICASRLWTQLLKEHSTVKISRRRSILKSYVQHIVTGIRDTLGGDISKLLYCMAKRLHKTVKLKNNILSNNCQDFSSAMLFNRDEWDHEFDGMYPRMPPRYPQTSGTMTMRYMMSFAGIIRHQEYFVNPLMSSLQLYDSFGRNDSDIIDHLINVRRDPHRDTYRWDTMFSHDVYLLKNTYMTCDERASCSFVDHLLDGPHDNISLLTTHIHRQRRLYTVPPSTPGDEGFKTLLINESSLEWTRNRLQILHRLRLLNSYLGILADEFGSLVSADNFANTQLRKAWRPVHSQIARGWSSNLRNGRNMAKPSWLRDMYEGEMTNSRWVFISTVWHTSPGVQARNAWKKRYSHLRKQLAATFKRKSKTRLPPPWTCNCSTCEQIWASTLCARATRHAASQQTIPPEGRSAAYLSNHPDFVPLDQLLSSIYLLGSRMKVVTDFLKQLTRTPEYLGYQKSTELQMEMFPIAYDVYYRRKLIHPTYLGEYPPFLEWLADVHDNGGVADVFAFEEQTQAGSHDDLGDLDEDNRHERDN